MKTYYEKPEAEVIDFSAKEKIAYVSEGKEEVGPKPEGSIGSKDF